MPQLTAAQRYQIASDIRRGLSIHSIAVGLNTYRRKVEREIARCGGRTGYTAEVAIAHRRGCAAISAANHPVKSGATWTWVESELMKHYLPSPAQVAQTVRQLAAQTSVSSARATVAPMLMPTPAAAPPPPDGVQTVSGSAIYDYILAMASASCSNAYAAIVPCHAKARCIGSIRLNRLRSAPQRCLHATVSVIWSLTLSSVNATRA